MSQDPNKTILLNSFYDLGAFKQDWIDGFTLSSGESSPYYVDCRILMSYPYLRRVVGTMGAWILRDKTLGCVGGLELGSVAVAQAVSDCMGVRSFIVRKQVKSHGGKRLIEGAITPGDIAVIIDDVFTTGKSIALAADAIRNAGLTVTDAVVVVDRSSDWVEKELFKKTHGITVHGLVTLRELEEWKSLS